MSALNFTLYHRACEARDAFERAVEAQFGAEVSCWEVSPLDFDDVTQAAYTTMLAANEAWRQNFQAAQAAHNAKRLSSTV